MREPSIICTGVKSANTVVFPPQAGTEGVINRDSACSFGCGNIFTSNWDSGEVAIVHMLNGSVESYSADSNSEGIGTVSSGVSVSSGVRS